jgi:hypothetical protein
MTIKNQTEYRVALARLSLLIERHPDPRSKEGKELRTLTEACHTYSTYRSVGCLELLTTLYTGLRPGTMYASPNR